MTDFPTAEEVLDDIRFSEVELDDNMIRQPALVAHYGRLVAEAQFKMDTAKQKLEIAESKAASNMRDEAAVEGRKISEAQINSELPTVSDVAKARVGYNRAKSDFEAMKVALEALRHKKDMMIQLAVNRRSEMENKINGLIRQEKTDQAGQDAKSEGRKAAEALRSAA